MLMWRTVYFGLMGGVAFCMFWSTYRDGPYVSEPTFALRTLVRLVLVFGVVPIIDRWPHLFIVSCLTSMALLMCTTKLGKSGGDSA